MHLYSFNILKGLLYVRLDYSSQVFLINKMHVNPDPILQLCGRQLLVRRQSQSFLPLLCCEKLLHSSGNINPWKAWFLIIWGQQASVLLFAVFLPPRS